MSESVSTIAMSRLNIAKEIAAMEQLSVHELRERFAALFQEATRARNRTWLIRRIIWRMQALVEGGLSESALRRARELANGADLRVTAPRERRAVAAAGASTMTVAATLRKTTTLLPGSVLTREYKGRPIHVTVLSDGFEWEGDRYKSLTAVAKAVTGKHWNGFHFFGLRQNGGGQ